MLDKVERHLLNETTLKSFGFNTGVGKSWFRVLEV